MKWNTGLIDILHPQVKSEKNNNNCYARQEFSGPTFFIPFWPCPGANSVDTIEGYDTSESNKTNSKETNKMQVVHKTKVYYQIFR